jgi:hypothetical protein
LVGGCREARQYLGNSNDFGNSPCRPGILLNVHGVHKPIHGTAIPRHHDRVVGVVRRWRGAALESVATTGGSLYTVAAARP